MKGEREVGKDPAEGQTAQTSKDTDVGCGVGDVGGVLRGKNPPQPRLSISSLLACVGRRERTGKGVMLTNKMTY